MVPMKMDDEAKKAANDRLARGGAIATGIGVFAVIANIGRDGSPIAVLLRKRKEKDSITGQDLSGKWELPGGGMKIADLLPGQDGYLGSIATALKREVVEETGIDLSQWNFNGITYPAMLAKQDTLLIDLALSVLIKWRGIFQTPEFNRAIDHGELRWVDVDDIDRIQLVSPRMQFLLDQAIKGGHY